MNYFIVITNKDKKRAIKEVRENFGVKKKYIYDDSMFNEYQYANKWIRVAYDLIKHSHDIVLITDNMEAFDNMFDYLNIIQKESKYKNKYYNILFADNDEYEYPKIFKEIYVYE